MEARRRGPEARVGCLLLSANNRGDKTEAEQGPPTSPLVLFSLRLMSSWLKKGLEILGVSSV